MESREVAFWKKDPYQHQLDCLEASKDRRGFALFSEMGTGKSLMLLMNACYLYKSGEIDMVVIVAPNGCYMNWIESEIPAHVPNWTNWKAAYWSSSAKKKEVEAMRDLNKPHDGLKFLVVNVEAVNSKKCLEYLVPTMRAHKCLMVVDESTTIKNPKAARTKTTVKLGLLAKYRRIISGNPMPNGPLDLYSQCYFLSKSLLGYPSYYAFRNDYAVMMDMKLGPRSFKKVVGYKDTERLKRLISGFSFIIKKKDCLDLPEKIYQTSAIQMSSEQAKVYDDLARDSYAMIESMGQSVSADMVMTRIMRCHQVANGFVKTDDGVEVSLGDNVKMDRLIETLNEVDGKAIVWATYRRSVREIAQRISEEFGPESVVTYDGDVTDEGRADARRKFKDMGSDVRFFVGNPKVGKYGLTLVEANTVIYYSSTFDLEDREQSEDRAHRIGQRFPVNYVDLVMRGTVEEKILKVLKGKKKLSDEIVASNWRWFFQT